MKSIVDQFNDLSKDLKTSNNMTEDMFTLKINELTFDFPLTSKAPNTNLGYMQPKDWLINEHKNNNLHEPGLVILLLLLGKKFEAYKITFWDIGALYGYFSILSKKIFNNVEVFSVEANPYSCEYIESTKKVSNTAVHKIINTFIDIKSTGVKEKYIYGYKFLNKSQSNQVIIKNLLCTCINFFKKKYEVITPEKVFIDHSSLADLLGNKNQSINILKIDTEGYQASFLPSVTQTLIDNKSIILLEFDEIKELEKFNSSNKKLCEPFLKNGYTLFWLDHRVKGAELEVKSKVDTALEINSLGLLMPPEYT